MSTTQETAVTQAAETPEPQSPTVTFAQQIAANLHKAVMEAISQIPGYHDDLSMQGQLARRVVTADFIARAVSAIETNGPLTAEDDAYVDETRKGQQFNEAFKPTVELFTGFSKRIELMMRVNDTEAGRGALRIYHVAKRLARNPNNTQLATHVRGMRAALPRREKEVTPPAAKKGGAIAA